MPRLPGYEPESEGARPYGSVTPELRAAGAAGEGMKELGSGLENAGKIIHETAANNERTQAYSVAAKANANAYQSLLDQTQSGTLNSQKFLSDFDEQTQSGMDQFHTPEGQAEYQKAMGDVRVSLAHRAIAGQINIAESNSLLNYREGLNTNSLQVMKDPSSYPSILKQQNDALETYVATGKLSRETANDEIMKTRQTLALSAFSGVHNTSISNFQATADGLAAQGMSSLPRLNKMRLQVPNISVEEKALGLYEKDMSPEQVEEIKTHLSEYHNQYNAVIDSAIRNVKQTDQDFQTNKMNDIGKKVYEGKSSPKEIINSGLNFKNMKTMMDVQRATSEQYAVDPKDFNSLVDNINSSSGSPNHISDVHDIYSALAEQKITPHQADFLTKMMKTTGEGKANSFNRTQLLKYMRSKLVQTSYMGSTDSVGELHYMQAVQGLQQAEDSLRAEGKDPSVLYNASSSHFFGNDSNVNQYAPSAQDRTNAALVGQGPSVVYSPTGVVEAPKAATTEAKYPDGYVKATGPDGKPAMVDPRWLEHGYKAIK